MQEFNTVGVLINLQLVNSKIKSVRDILNSYCTTTSSKYFEEEVK